MEHPVFGYAVHILFNYCINAHTVYYHSLIEPFKQNVKIGQTHPNKYLIQQWLAVLQQTITNTHG